MITFQRRWLEDVTMCILHTDIVSLFCTLSIFWFFVSRIQDWDSRKRFEFNGFSHTCYMKTNLSIDSLAWLKLRISGDFRTLLTKRPSTLTMTGLLQKKGKWKIVPGCCHFKNNGCFDNVGIREQEMDFILLYSWYSWTYFDMYKSCPWRGNGNMPLSTGESLIVDRQTPTPVAMVNIIPQNHTVSYGSQVARDFVHQLQHHTWTQGAVLEPHQQ